MKYKYTILSYNFDSYDILHEPLEIDPECEYLYITDKPTTSKNWKIIIDDSLNGLSSFEKCYKVRYNLFKYATTNVCIYLDSNVHIFKSLNKLYTAFINSNCDIGLNIHPVRNTLVQEYFAWIKTRQYPMDNAIRILKYIKSTGYNLAYKGLYQGTLRICKNTGLNHSIDSDVFDLQVKMGTDGIIERITQTLYSFVLNSKYNNIKVFPIADNILRSEYMNKCLHYSNEYEAKYKYIINPYVFNKKIYNLYDITL